MIRTILSICLAMLSCSALAEFQNIGGSVSLTQSAQGFDRVRRSTYVNVRITNISGAPIQGDMRLLLHGSNVYPQNVDGSTVDAVPFVDLTNASLAVGGATTVRVDFPLTRAKLSFTPGLELDVPMPLDVESVEMPVTVHGDTTYPSVGASITVTLNTGESVDGVAWQLATAPDGSVASLSIDATNRFATFVPDREGPYDVMVSSGDHSQTRRVFVRNDLPYDESKIVVVDTSVPLEESVGVITNQAWVRSDLPEAEILAIVGNYSNIQIIDYSAVRGLLVEYDEKSTEAQADLDDLRVTVGVRDVLPRVYIGPDAVHPDLAEPTDESGSFSDGGDNWHLEKIDILGAWSSFLSDWSELDSLPSMDAVVVGVLDSGFDARDPDFTSLTPQFAHEDISVARTIPGTSYRGLPYPYEPQRIQR